MKRTIVGLLMALATAVALTGCSSSNPVSGGSSGGTVKIGSANFPENVVLAQIYGQALQAKGVTVEVLAPLASREAYFPGLKDGSIDLVPDYTGVLLQYLKKDATQTTPEEVYTALKAVVPAPLTVLDKSSAEDKDAVVVTKATADKYQAKSIADLAPHCAEIVFGGPPEFQTRADGTPGLTKNYNCTFKEYKALDTAGPLTVKALSDGTVQAADLFTTQSAIAANGFVVLDDPKSNFAAQNVVPLINSGKATDTVKSVLNAISAKLDTKALLDLVAKLSAADKPAPALVAKEWLQANGLL